jgi:hypothetical protein
MSPTTRTQVHAIEQQQAKQTLERVSTESKVHRKRLEEIKLREIAAQERIVNKAKLIAKAKRQVEVRPLPPPPPPPPPPYPPPPVAHDGLR